MSIDSRRERFANCGKSGFSMVATIWFTFAILVSCSSAEENLGWRTIETLEDANAFQAAAADLDFFYAINNREISKIDRRTKVRVAVSDGRARHLNSGYLLKGKLYCAHSNYPLVPERSRIKVLNTTSMKLTDHHDFGNYGGSLTWIVRHEGHWWCNFAKYGAENGNTFLAKFTDDWQEVARWSYPEIVISQLGRYSLSGGLWKDGQLVVTGHDAAIVFVLVLPKTGKVLKFVEQQVVPFHGQGFAHDPKTNGFIGIVRAKRQLVLSVRGK